jgi:exopolyphosphatase/guanosine-5'-triphosphate,3'-diphosphate pyrophosphatase
LAALIRVADGLDRSHGWNTQGLRLSRDGARATLLVKQRRPNPTDIWGAMRKRALFEEVFAVDLDIIPEDA